MTSRMVEDDESSTAVEIPVLHTERLRLRGWTPTDLKVLSRLYQNEEVTEYFSSLRDEPFTLEEVRFDWSRHGFGMWAVVDRSSGVFIGSIGLAQPAHSPDMEMAWVVDPQFWGRGLATEAARAVLEFAFERLGVERITSSCLAENRRSERVMKRLGMELVSPDTADELVRHYVMTRQKWSLQGSSALSPVR